jgi:ribosomal protein S18 acetylase RimI-like enzyme
MNIRQATTADVRGIAAVQLAGWQTAYRNLIPEDFLAGLQQHHFEEGTIKSLPDIFVTELAGEIVGMSAYGVGRDDTTLGEVRAFYVAPHVQRQGIGNKLMQQVLKHLFEQHETVYLWVLKDNQPAVAFYEAMGFTNTNETKALTFKNQQVDEQQFEIHREQMPSHF